MLEIAGIGTQAIAAAAGGGAVGVDPKYDPAYDVLLEQLNRLGSATAGAPIDWAVVAQSAQKIITAVGKDIPAACYLAVALGHSDGFSGWVLASRELLAMLQQYWADCFPPVKRMRARVNALAWWNERSLMLLRDWFDGEPLAFADHGAAVSMLSELDAFAGEHLPDLPPFYELRESLQRLPVQSPPQPPAAEGSAAHNAAPADGADGRHNSAAEKQTPASPSANGDTPAQVALPAAASASASTPSVLAVSALPTATDNRAVAEALRQLSGDILNMMCGKERLGLGEVLCWKVLYCQLWGGVQRLPAAENQLTAIPDPDGEILVRARQMMGAGRLDDALAQLLSYMPASPFCLDLHAIVAEILAKKGAPFALARQVVEQETAALLARLPGVELLKFAEGRAFASQKTRAWLAAMQSVGSAEAVQDEVAVRVEEQLQAGHWQEALRVLDGACAQKAWGDGESYLRLRLQQLQILCQQEAWSLAAALLQAVGETTEHHDLRCWNRALAVQYWQMAYRVWQGVGEAEGGKKSAAALQELVQLSAADALALLTG